nr:OmpA family protein [Fuscovulum blasticum]
MPPRSVLPLVAALLFPLSAAAEAAFRPVMPAPVTAEASSTNPHGSYNLPVGLFGAEGVPVHRLEGALDRRAYRLDAPGAPLLDVLVPLRDQLVAAGYEVVFQCEDRRCGGFDFRFATDVIPEPAMHVDLGEFRFLAALRGEEGVGVLVSRSTGAVFVQVIQISAQGAAAPALTSDTPLNAATPAPDAVPLPAAPVSPVTPPSADAAAPDMAPLDAGLPVALDDLVFASGSGGLEPGAYPSLLALAGWLGADPARRVMLVGHTDASGGLAANVALSKKRAEAVRQALIQGYGVDAARVTAEGAGPLSPRATNATEDGRTRNRRVEAVPLVN